MLSERSIKQFWRKVRCASPNECWEWQGLRLKTGYGRFGERLAHRVAYELTYGEIPTGLCVCHSCDNRHCCNPAHLWLGTKTENNADREAKGRGAKGERNGNAKLSPTEVKSIRALYQSGHTQKVIAEQFGIARSMVGFIVRRIYWPDVD